MKSYVVYEMTSGSLAKMISRPYIESKHNAIPYVSEDGNFVILFDKQRNEKMQKSIIILISFRI